MLVDVVVASVGAHSALESTAGEASVILVHVVLNKRVGSPTVNGKENGTGLSLEVA
jgi:hypothetical protein